LAKYGTAGYLSQETRKVHVEALKPIIEFRQYKMSDSVAIRDFYSLLRGAIKGA
jgi:hypothetical protein